MRRQPTMHDISSMMDTLVPRHVALIGGLSGNPLRVWISSHVINIFLTCVNISFAGDGSGARNYSGCSEQSSFCDHVTQDTDVTHS